MVPKELAEGVAKALARRLVAFLQALEQSLPLQLAQATGVDPAIVEPILVKALDDGRRQLAEEATIQISGVEAGVKKLQMAARKKKSGEGRGGRKAKVAP